MNKQALEEIFKDIAELVEKKNRDYGDENVGVFGDYGIVIRLWDKMCRLKNIYFDKNNKPRNPECQNESVEDTFRDIVGYAGIGIMWLNKLWAGQEDK